MTGTSSVVIRGEGLSESDRSLLSTKLATKSARSIEADPPISDSSASSLLAPSSFRSNLRSQLAFLASGLDSDGAEAASGDSSSETIEPEAIEAAANQPRLTPARVASLTLSFKAIDGATQRAPKPGVLTKRPSDLMEPGVAGARKGIDAQDVRGAKGPGADSATTKAKRLLSGLPPQMEISYSLPASLNGQTLRDFSSGSYRSGVGPGNASVGREQTAAGTQATDTHSQAQENSPRSNVIQSPRADGSGTAAGSGHDAPRDSAPDRAGDLSRSEATRSAGGIRVQTPESALAITPGHDANYAQQGSAEGQLAPASVTREPAAQAPFAGDGATSHAGSPDAAGQTQSNRGVASNSSTSVQGVKRTSQGSSTSGNRNVSTPSQFAAVSGDTTLIVRDPAGGRELTAPVAGSVAAAPGLRETFAALDADAAPGSPTWTHAGPRQAEGGFEDPALGWIGVRAGRNGGGVHVALVPASAEAARELGGHLDGLNAYLAQEHTPVQSVAMASPESRAAGFSREQSMSQGLERGMEQGSGHGMGQETHQGAGQGAGQNTHAHSEGESTSAAAMAGIDGPGSTVSVQVAGRGGVATVLGSAGRYISVMA